MLAGELPEWTLASNDFRDGGVQLNHGRSTMARSRSMVEHFAEVSDPRVERTKQHELVDILCLAVLAVIAGAEG